MSDESERPVTVPTAPSEAADRVCESCGSPTARWWSTPDGKALLCPQCATLHGIGCP